MAKRIAVLVLLVVFTLQGCSSVRIVGMPEPTTGHTIQLDQFTKNRHVANETNESLSYHKHSHTQMTVILYLYYAVAIWGAYTLLSD